MYPNRRHLLVAMGGAIAMAGCLGDDEDEDDDDAPPDDDDDDDDPPADEDDTDDEGDDEPADDDDDPDDEADEDDGVEDDPEAEHTVAVGHQGDFVFDPESLEIDAGETVEFVWEGDGHNILVNDQPDDGDWEGVEDTYDEGHTESHTFEAEGRYEYICGPHEGQGMDGEILVGDVDPDEEDGDEDDDDDGGPGGGY